MRCIARSRSSLRDSGRALKGVPDLGPHLFQLLLDALRRLVVLRGLDHGTCLADIEATETALADLTGGRDHFLVQTGIVAPSNDQAGKTHHARHR